MLALDGSYAPSLFRIRQRGVRVGDEPHSCWWYRLILVQEGGITFTIDGTEHRASDGDVCLLPPCDKITIRRPPSLRSIWLAFTVMACQHRRDHRGQSPALTGPDASPQQVWGCELPLIQDRVTAQLVATTIEMIAATSWISPLDRLSGNQRLSYVLECLVRAHYDRERENSIASSAAQHPIGDVHTVVVEHLPYLHCAKDIARRLATSVSSMNKHYRAATGDTPMAFLRRYRLSETARLLQNSQLSLTAIAEQVGYRNSKALYKAWAATYDIPPRRWRLLHCQDGSA